MTNHLGSLLKAARIKRKTTLRQFAILHGLDAGNLSRMERGLSLPCHSNVRELARLYGADERKAVAAFLADLKKRMVDKPL